MPRQLRGEVHFGRKRKTHLRERLPSWRHWFSGSAVVGFLGMAVGLGFGVFGVAPLVERGVMWALVAGGVLLSLFAWYVLARAEQRSEASERRASSAERRAESSHRIVEALPDLLVRHHKELTEEVLRLNALYQRGTTVTPMPGELTLTGYEPEVVSDETRRAVLSWAELQVPNAPPQNEAEQKVLDDAIEAQEERVLHRIVALTGTGGGTGGFGTAKLTMPEPSDPPAAEQRPGAGDDESSSG